MNKNKRLIPYVGYGKSNTIIIMGSVLYQTIERKSKHEDSIWVNAKQMLQLFLTKPTVNEEVTLLFNQQSKNIITDKNGYFKTTLHLNSEIKAGWHSVYYFLNKGRPNEIMVENKCIILDNSTPFGVISDIDDTIVVSHAYRFRKKIWTALSKNTVTRKPNKILAKFYNKLHQNKTPFFYVSSSERNLYEFWSHFMKTNNFPLGPLLLKELKYGITDLIFSGKGKHHHKYDKISQLLKFYPFLNFVLVGDNGQKDEQIYHRIVLDFPGRINSVFIVPSKHKRMNKKIVADYKKHHVNFFIIKHNNNFIKEALNKVLM
jgi:phosphatidate phosphatase APP1